MSATQKTLNIGIVTGEASGDILGAGLIQALQNLGYQVSVTGIAGPKMLALGATSLFPQDRLAVMGLWEPLKRLPELLRIRRQLIEHFKALRPDVVIGIDSPDFNTELELQLRQAGIKTAHYVSPSVWAWRQGRIKKIALAVDLMLTLFPFEAAFYQSSGVPVTCVGHPLADEIPLKTDTRAAKQSLGFEEDEILVALLPGSRRAEVAKLGELFLEVAARLHAENGGGGRIRTFEG